MGPWSAVCFQRESPAATTALIEESARCTQSLEEGTTFLGRGKEGSRRRCHRPGLGCPQQSSRRVGEEGIGSSGTSIDKCLETWERENSRLPVAGDTAGDEAGGTE